MSYFGATDPGQQSGDFLFLEGLTPREWGRIISFAETRNFARGDILVAVGDQDQSFYILTAGSAEIVLGSDVVGQISKGTVFGEIAFFDGLPRSATIRALEPGSALRVAKSAFDDLAAWEPVLGRRILLDLGRILAIRFRGAQRRQRK